MKKRKLKRFVVPMMYVLSIVMLVGSVVAIERIVNNAIFKNDAEDLNDVEEVIFNEDEFLDDGINDIPVINTDVAIIRPYVDSNVKIVKNYYDYQADASNQESSIVYYGNIYMQNSGVDYKLEEVFDVVSVLDGKIISVEDNDMMGTTVQIKHDNNLISVYQSLSNVKVKVDDTIIQGQVIAQSGESNINKDLGNHLHFELYHNGNIVNPEEYYNKSIEEL